MTLNNLTVLVALGLGVATAQAQSLAINWFTIDGGGGSATGGGYALSGTAGQPDAGTMTGGGFTFHGGFWGGAVDWVLPRVHITKRAGKFVLSWPASVNAVVQTATSLTPPDPIWQSYPVDPMRVGNDFELTIDPGSFPTDPMRLFRLARP